MIYISIKSQSLSLLRIDGSIEKQYTISSALNGIGSTNGSYKTPLGLHYISETYGHADPLNTVFVARRKTGEIYSQCLAEKNPNRDWILTRILRLSGLEPEYNMGGNVDTYNRYIYIHGCPDDIKLGAPGSHGCIRMRNSDIVELFSLVNSGFFCYIAEEDFTLLCYGNIMKKIDKYCCLSD